MTVTSQSAVLPPDAFCNPFDAALAASGCAAMFLMDREGKLRFDETWSRDVWGRTETPHTGAAAWLLMRDHGTGYVTLAYASARDLLVKHPRLDIRAYDTLAEATAARDAFGHPPIATEAW